MDNAGAINNLSIAERWVHVRRDVAAGCQAIGTSLAQNCEAIGGRIAGGARQAGQGVCWFGRQVKHYVLDPVARAAVQLASYTWHEKKSVISNLCSWGIIILFCGAMHGFQTVSLPMIIAVGPGMAFGMLGGMLTAKAVAHNPGDENDGFISNIHRQYNAIPQWTKTLLLALSSSIYVLACTTVPYATGALGGIVLGAAYGYKATRFDPNTDPKPTHVQQVEQNTSRLRVHAQHINELHSQSGEIGLLKQQVSVQAEMNKTLHRRLEILEELLRQFGQGASSLTLSHPGSEQTGSKEVASS